MILTLSITRPYRSYCQSFEDDDNYVVQYGDPLMSAMVIMNRFLRHLLPSHPTFVVTFLKIRRLVTRTHANTPSAFSLFTSATMNKDVRTTVVHSVNKVGAHYLTHPPRAPCAVST